METLVQSRKKLLKDLEYSESERPIVAQIFGGRSETIEKASALCRELGFDGIDINMGCPDRSIEKSGAGAATIKEMCPDVLLIFLTTENEPELERRLRARKSETPGGLKLRIATARKELQRLHEFDYWVVNADDNLDTAVDIILAIIEAEHHRVGHRVVTL